MTPNNELIFVQSDLNIIKKLRYFLVVGKLPCSKQQGMMLVYVAECLSSLELNSP